LKKIIVLLILASMLLSFLIPLIAYAEPQDIYLSSGKTLEGLGILKGDAKSNLMLNNKLKREDMVILVSRLYKEENEAKNYLLKPKFTDLSKIDSMYVPYIGWAVDKGFIKGLDEKTFGVGMDVTVHQFMAVLMRVLGYEEESGLWNTVPELARALGIMEGLKNNSNEQLTRGQMAVMTLNTLQLTKKGSSLTLSEVLKLSVD